MLYTPLLLALQSNMKSMGQELHCPVCDEMVKQPILLPCLHSVCLLCAAEVLVQRGYPPPDLPAEPISPASTPNTRSPRQARKPVPRTPDHLERVFRTGARYWFWLFQCVWRFFDHYAGSLTPITKWYQHLSEQRYIYKKAEMMRSYLTSFWLCATGHLELYSFNPGFTFKYVAKRIYRLHKLFPLWK